MKTFFQELIKARQLKFAVKRLCLNCFLSICKYFPSNISSSYRFFYLELAQILPFQKCFLCLLPASFITFSSLWETQVTLFSLSED